MIGKYSGFKHGIKEKFVKRSATFNGACITNHLRFEPELVNAIY